MTWSAAQSGHHKSDEWRDEEYELLRGLVEAVEDDDSTVVTAFTFNGNHVQAINLGDAKTKLEAYDSEEK